MAIFISNIFSWIEYYFESKNENTTNHIREVNGLSGLYSETLLMNKIRNYFIRSQKTIKNTNVGIIVAVI